MKPISQYIEAIDKKLRISVCELLDKRLSQKIVVIESDDWGSLRMPSQDVLCQLSNKGMHFFTDIGYDKFDTIESEKDIEVLMDAIDGYRDCEGNPAIITLNSVVANPNFERIRASNYNEYYYETIDKSYLSHDGCAKSLDLIKDGINSGLFKVQYHGREHNNVPFWLRLLQERNKDAILSFEKGVWSMKVDDRLYGRNHSLAAYDTDNSEGLKYVCKSLCDGIDIFERIYGYRPLSMIAPNYTWDAEIEKSALESGIIIIQGTRVQRASLFKRKNGGKNFVHYIGEKNIYGQLYLIRNCIWEPSQRESFNSDYCLAQISKVFKQGKPAIISAHRLNFIGGLDKKNRDNNIKDFKRLLREILQAFPDVVFMSSDELGKLLLNQKN